MLRSRLCGAPLRDLFGLLVGSMIEHFGYGPAFLAAGVLHPLAFVTILATVRRIRPLFAEASGFPVVQI